MEIDDSTEVKKRKVAEKQNKKEWGERGSNSRPQDHSRLAMRPTR